VFGRLERGEGGGSSFVPGWRDTGLPTAHGHGFGRPTLSVDTTYHRLVTRAACRVGHLLMPGGNAPLHEVATVACRPSRYRLEN